MGGVFFFQDDPVVSADDLRMPCRKITLFLATWHRLWHGEHEGPRCFHPKNGFACGTLVTKSIYLAYMVYAWRIRPVDRVYVSPLEILDYFTSLLEIIDFIY